MTKTDERPNRTADVPEAFTPVLARIEHQVDLAAMTWYEVVFHDGEAWCGFYGGTQFEDGERVTRWVVAAQVLP